jgi:YegS/Rv2252/BmrU family lipid kinase
MDKPARRLLLIYNPTAGRRAQDRLACWRRALTQLGVQITLAETQAPLHAQELARDAEPARFDAVAVAGGDGTINEAVNGLMVSKLPLAVLPLGTANVLAQELNLPRGIEALAQIAAFAPARPVWPGEIMAKGMTEPWRFLLMAGIGFDAEVVANIDLRWKRRLGKGAYVIESLKQLARHAPRGFTTRINELDRNPAALVIARAHFYGGRFVLAPKARLDEPLLHAVLFPGPSRLAALRYMTAMVTGRLARQRDVEFHTAERIVIDGPDTVPVQIDGDIRAYLPVSIGLAAEPLQIIA